MASGLSSLLPKPKNLINNESLNESSNISQTSLLKSTSGSNELSNESKTNRNISEEFNKIIKTSSEKYLKLPPSYGQRNGFVPKDIEDFGDGGAFPEILIAQFPLNMGLKKINSNNNTVTLNVDSVGNIKYDVLARIGHSKDRIVHSSHSAMIPKNISETELFSRPSDEDILKTTDETRLSLEKIVHGKIQSSKPKTIQSQSKEHSLIRYIPAQQGPLFNSGANERIIRMVELPVDPMEPPKFKHKRVPRGPPSPPPPVLHSPPRRATVEEQKAWVIPPSISNWKNPKGYTIPLDKRLASDGRGLQEVVINEKFAIFAESLYIAEHHARQEVENRNALEKKLAEKEKRIQDEKLRQLAQQSREERAGISSELKKLAAIESEHLSTALYTNDSIDQFSEITNTSLASHISTIEEREKIRLERAKERERELKLSKMGQEQRSKILAREQERDISEKIALGISQPTITKETLFDQRLFNRSEGIASGFGTDDSYDLYDRPLFTGSSANVIYQPKRGLESIDDENIDIIDEADHPSANKIVKMLSSSSNLESTEPRVGPVQFERGEVNLANNPPIDDPFGLDTFLKEAKKGKSSSSMNKSHKNNTSR